MQNKQPTSPPPQTSQPIRPGSLWIFDKVAPLMNQLTVDKLFVIIFCLSPSACSSTRLPLSLCFNWPLVLCLILPPIPLGEYIIMYPSMNLFPAPLLIYNRIFRSYHYCLLEWMAFIRKIYRSTLYSFISIIINKDIFTFLY